MRGTHRMWAKRSPMSPRRVGALRAASLLDRPSPVRVEAPASRQHDRFTNTAGSRRDSLLVSERAGFSIIGEPSDGTFSSVKRTCRPAQPSPEQMEAAVGNSRIVLSG